MSTKIRILGIDPSLRNTGLAVGDYDLDSGTLDIFKVDLIQTERFADGLKVRKSSDDLKCAQAIAVGLRKAIAEHKPAFACSEVSVFSQSSRGMFTNGVCCGVLGSLTIPVIEVSGLEVKLAAGGTKTSSKDFMMQWAIKKWPNAGWRTRKFKGAIELLNDNEHLADACAAMTAGIHTPQFAQAIAMMQAMAAVKA